MNKIFFACFIGAHLFMHGAHVEPVPSQMPVSRGLYQTVPAIKRVLHSHGFTALAIGCATWGICQLLQLKKLESWLKAQDRWSNWCAQHGNDENMMEQLDQAIAQAHEKAYRISPFFAYQLLLKEIGDELHAFAQYRAWTEWAYNWNCARILDEHLLAQLDERAAILLAMKESCLHLFIQKPSLA